MCHPSYDPLLGYGYARRYVPRREVVRRREELPVAVAGGGDGETKKCVCSPTIHPGSFKCRYHHEEYKWGCMIKKLKGSIQLFAKSPLKAPELGRKRARLAEPGRERERARLVEELLVVGRDLAVSGLGNGV
ncbi:hypothetical protein ACFE04_003968 [Oxalis oulophora]